MSVSRATKVEWFERGAAAFEQQFPGVLEKEFGKGVGPLYVCPLCEPPRVFQPASIDTGDLTADHVPPESLGGRELVLTCKRCNNEAGSRLDAQAKRKENSIDLFSGRPTDPQWVRIKQEGQEINAQLSLADDGFVFRVLGEHNNPKTVAAFRETAPKKGTTLNVAFRERYSDLGAKLSWYRSAYLVLFAVAGYRFVFDPATRIVRKQLSDWTQRHIECFTVTNPGHVPAGTRRLLEIRSPEALQGCAVQFDRYLLLLPHKGDMNFYERVSSHVAMANDQQQHFDVSEAEWPVTPTFGLSNAASITTDRQSTER